MRTQMIVSEAGAGLRRNLTMTVAAVMTVAISLSLLGVALIIRSGINRDQRDLLNTIEVSVYLDKPCGPNAPAPPACLQSDAERTQVQQTLQQLPQVKAVTYISSASAYQRFKEEFADDKPLLKAAPPDALPDSFAVKLNDPRQFDVVNSAVGQAPGVESVTNANGTLNTLFKLLRRLTLGTLVFVALAIGSTILLIYNTMRISAFSRRRETGIMRLVGSSDFFIQAPFVLEGITIGLLGTGLAILIMVAVREFVFNFLSISLLRPFGLWSTMLSTLPVVIAVGIVLPALASFATLQRHLRV
jgi:cell division transport system permease protein